MDPIKRGDSVTVALDLAPQPESGSTARVIIAPYGGPPVVDKPAVLIGARVTFTLTAAETATAGTYQVEIECMPGPVTYPSDGYEVLRIVPDLG